MDKKEIKEIIETTILAYRCGLDEINEIYVDEAKRCKGDKTKLAELSRKSFLEEVENKKSAIEYGVSKICKFRPKNQVVIAEGKVIVTQVGDYIGGKSVQKICEENNLKKVKIILEMQDAK